MSNQFEFSVRLKLVISTQPIASSYPKRTRNLGWANRHHTEEIPAEGGV